LSENLTGRGETEKLDPALSWVGRHRLRTVHRKSKLDPITYIYSYDGRTGTREYYITYQELAYSYSIILISATAFGTGIGQFLRYFWS
jgi:hypothetical protein